MKVSKTDTLLLTILIVCGFFLRSWNFKSISLDHFDEGVYLFSALGLVDHSQPHTLYPNQERFSPPLYIGLLSLAYRIFGGHLDQMALWVNIVLGTMTIPLIWLVGRWWFGKITGLAAATLLTFNEFHIIFSRSALTDVSFCFFFLLALLLISLSVQSQKFWLAILAGIAVGLAWNAKYHGWFAIVITGLALLPYIWYNRLRGDSFFRLISLFGLITLVSLLGFLPWAFFVHTQLGGYSSLASYQSTMINQPLISYQYFKNIIEHASQQLTMEGPISRIGIPLAYLIAVPWQTLDTHRKRYNILILVLHGLATLIMGEAIASLVLALLAIPTLLRQRIHYPAWLLLAWLGFFAFSTPFYRPYARLLMPFTLACFLASGVWMQDIISRLPRVEVIRRRRLSIPIAITLALFGVSFIIPDAGHPWQAASGMAKAAQSLQESIPEGERVIVLAEPALAFYLHQSGRPSFERIEDFQQLAAVNRPTYLVIGVYTNRAPPLRQGIESLKNRLQVIGTYPLTPRLVRVLDDFNGQNERKFLTNPDNTYELTLYRLVQEH